VQTLINLDEVAKNDKPKLGELKMTVAQFFRINGGTTQLKGVTPDIRFPSAFESDEFGEASFDNALPWRQIARRLPPGRRDPRHPARRCSAATPAASETRISPARRRRRPQTQGPAQPVAQRSRTQARKGRPRSPPEGPRRRNRNRWHGRRRPAIGRTQPRAELASEKALKARKDILPKKPPASWATKSS
jgi:carboxyl-terminal processing protease